MTNSSATLKILPALSTSVRLICCQRLDREPGWLAIPQYAIKITFKHSYEKWKSPDVCKECYMSSHSLKSLYLSLYWIPTWKLMHPSCTNCSCFKGVISPTICFAPDILACRLISNTYICDRMIMATFWFLGTSYCSVSIPVHYQKDYSPWCTVGVSCMFSSV